ncbi:MAG: ABC transporter substrate-binding protein [Desulfobacterales bacterium]|nr:ABC transporter substrate-binding protein [Desulfobacterales bacterium]
MKCIKSILVLGIFLLLATPVVGSASPAQDQLKTSIDGILTVLKDPGFKAESQREMRRQALRDIVYTRFDFRKMSQLSLARHWKALSPAQKDEFTDLFSKLLESTYIGRIEAYTNEKVEFLGERIKKKKAQINTRIVTQDIEIPINYRMFTRGDGNWMVYDMIIEGVSLVGNYRSQFAQLMEKGSFEDLIGKLRAKVGTL